PCLHRTNSLLRLPHFAGPVAPAYVHWARSAPQQQPAPITSADPNASASDFPESLSIGILLSNSVGNRRPARCVDRRFNPASLPRPSCLFRCAPPPARLAPLFWRGAP